MGVLYDQCAEALQVAVAELLKRGDKLTIPGVCTNAARLLPVMPDMDAQFETALDLEICFHDQCNEEGFPDEEWETSSLRTDEEVVALLERVIAGKYLRERMTDDE
jgi:hypothetical protein